MAGDAVVGALRVVLGMDTATFEDGLKSAEKSLGSFGSSMAKLGTAAAAAATAGFVFLGHELSKTLDEIDKLGKTAQKVGLPVEDFTRLGLAAALSDVSMESLSTALGKLSKNMVETAKGTGEARDKFADLGIKVTNTDGTLRGVNEVLADLAGKFETSKDGAAKVAIAMALLGKGGKDLIPLLNEGKNSLVEMAQAAEKMGLVISKQTSEQVQKFNDNVKLLQLAKQGLTNQIVAGLIPALVNLTNQFVETAKSGDQIKRAADAVVLSVKSMTGTLFEAVEVAKLLVAANTLLFQLTPIGIMNFGALKQALDNFLSTARDLPENLRKAKDEATKLFLTVEAEGKPALTDLATGSSKVSDAILDLQIKTRILKGDFAALPPGFVEAAKGLKLFAQSSDEARVTFAQLPASLQALATAQAEFNAAQITQDLLTPWQQYEQQILKVKSAFEIGKLSSDNFALANQKAGFKLAETWGNTASAIVTPMASAFKELATMNKKYAGIAKAAAIAEATVNTYLAATKALAEVPPPFNYAAAAVVVAAGLVHVAKIASTDFATGGSFKVGGAGGIDSQLVQFNATPGEMVDVRKGEDAKNNRGTTELIVPAIKPKDLFSGDTVRELLIAVDQWHRDGGQGMRFAT